MNDKLKQLSIKTGLKSIQKGKKSVPFKKKQ